MKNEINTGGPAFPVQYSNEADGPTVMPSEGMSLRDYFAGMAMQGSIGIALEGYSSDTVKTTIGKFSYDIADAMLKAREVKR